MQWYIFSTILSSIVSKAWYFCVSLGLNKGFRVIYWSSGAGPSIFLSGIILLQLLCSYDVKDHYYRKCHRVFFVFVFLPVLMNDSSSRLFILPPYEQCMLQLIQQTRLENTKRLKRERNGACRPKWVLLMQHVRVVLFLCSVFMCRQFSLRDSW